MTPDACMAYAEQWLAKHYPHQQVILALHEESDKEGKRFAVHMAINRTDLLTGKRLWEGTGAQAKHKRASWVREMDEVWNLTQLERERKIRRFVIASRATQKRRLSVAVSTVIKTICAS